MCSATCRLLLAVTPNAAVNRAPARKARREPNGNAVRRSLGSWHEVVVIARAGEAIERIRGGEAFDVILCDLMMPHMTGMEFHAALGGCAGSPAERVIFMTGGAFTPAARAFLDEVPNQRFEKPFDAQFLRALVDEQIKARG